MSEGDRPAVLFLTHRWDRLVRLRFERLVAEAGELADVFLLMQQSEAADRAEAEGGAIAPALVRFDVRRLPEVLGYPFAFKDQLSPGSVHFPVLDFARKHRRGHYFLIEYDVEFSGDWSDFLAGTLASGPDCATLHIRTKLECPNWVWWNIYRPSSRDRGWALEPESLRRSFNPVYCLSHRAVERMHQAHREGWRGHHELLMPTILMHCGYKVVDLRRSNDFCVGFEQELRHAMPLDDLSTVRWRPDVSASEFEIRSRGHTLFHPVKDGWYFDGQKLVVLGEG